TEAIAGAFGSSPAPLTSTDRAYVQGRIPTYLSEHHPYSHERLRDISAVPGWPEHQVPRTTVRGGHKRYEDRLGQRIELNSDRRAVHRCPRQRGRHSLCHVLPTLGTAGAFTWVA